MNVGGNNYTISLTGGGNGRRVRNRSSECNGFVSNTSDMTNSGNFGSTLLSDGTMLTAPPVGGCPTNETFLQELARCLRQYTTGNRDTTCCTNFPVATLVPLLAQGSLYCIIDYFANYYGLPFEQARVDAAIAAFKTVIPVEIEFNQIGTAFESAFRAGLTYNTIITYFTIFVVVSIVVIILYYSLSLRGGTATLLIAGILGLVYLMSAINRLTVLSTVKSHLDEVRRLITLHYNAIISALPRLPEAIIASMCAYVNAQPPPPGSIPSQFSSILDTVGVNMNGFQNTQIPQTFFSPSQITPDTARTIFASGRCC